MRAPELNGDSADTNALLPAIAGEIGSLWRRIGESTRARGGVWTDQPPSTAPTIDHAVRCFGLSPTERDIVVFLLGMLVGRQTGPGLRTVCVADLVATLGTTRDRTADIVAALEPDRTLARHELVTFGPGTLLERTIVLADMFWPRLIGIHPSTPVRVQERVTPGLGELVGSGSPTEVLAARDWLCTGGEHAATLIVHGRPGSGRGALALALASELGRGTVVLGGEQITNATARSLRREIAWLQSVAVILDADRAEPAALVDLATQLSCPLVVTAATPMLERWMSAGRRFRVLGVPSLDDVARTGIWRSALARAGIDTAQLDARYLGARFPFTPARIVAVASALSQSNSSATTDEAVALCRAIPEVGFGGLAVKLETPYAWEDLVVPPRIRAELELVVTWGRVGPALFAADGIGARARCARGLTCLLHGPPGTGKTLAVQVIARELALDLYRVDLSQVVDKYIGETEKRLELLFREAEQAGVVLLFDEADALFGQRTEVRDSHDRYANLETGFLLQRLEEHRGLTILASNLQRNLDAAFQRRFGVVIELPVPGPSERRRIWEKLLPDRSQRAGDIDLDLLQRIALAGGDIRNAVFAAHLFAARDALPIAMRHLVIAVWRELSKAGRLVDPAELGAWQDVIIAHVGPRE